jgi:hypothetical protein
MKGTKFFHPLQHSFTDVNSRQSQHDGIGRIFIMLKLRYELPTSISSILRKQGEKLEKKKRNQKTLRRRGAPEKECHNA